MTILSVQKQYYQLTTNTDISVLSVTEYHQHHQHLSIKVVSVSRLAIAQVSSALLFLVHNQYLRLQCSSLFSAVWVKSL